jgi:RNA-directed DNA polymerase
MTANNYKSINWELCNRTLLARQYEILIAFRNGDKNLVLKLQHELTRSFAARALAVRKITSNKGKNTPGVDNILLNTDNLKMQCINKLKNLKNYKATPVKRTYIKKKASGSLRPLGIPTFFDRAVQTLHLFTIEPIMEELSCTRAYGFRIGKSLHDNASYLFLVLASYTATRRFVLNADISKFFDTVSHEWLKNNVLMNKKVLSEFLNAGFIDLNIRHNTTIGFPQGSPISPALANITLSGLQNLLGPEFLCTRYADDFVVLGKSELQLKTTATNLINEFLNPRGLQLNAEKTTVAKIEHGFDFLGLNFREYADPTRVKGTKQGILLIKPQRSKVLLFIKDCTNLIKLHKNSKTVLLLINKLNQKLRGFAEHYRRYVSKQTFTYINYRLFKAIYAMLSKKHKGVSKKWINAKYFCRLIVNKRTSNWNFCYKFKDRLVLTMFNISQVPIKRHQISKAGNPYDPVNYANVKARVKYLSNSAITSSKTKSKLLTIQTGVCLVCGAPLLNSEDLNIHHRIPIKNGGSHRINNLALLHQVCHRQVEYTKNIQLQAAFRAKNLK